MGKNKRERGSDVTDGLGLVDHNALGERACQVLDRTVKQLRQGHSGATELIRYPALYRPKERSAADGPGLGLGE
jgi:hypothetical protein